LLTGVHVFWFGGFALLPMAYVAATAAVLLRAWHLGEGRLAMR
jgi:hypothetical protein